MNMPNLLVIVVALTTFYRCLVLVSIMHPLTPHFIVRLIMNATMTSIMKHVVNPIYGFCKSLGICS
jgi:hypothetical protein